MVIFHSYVSLPEGTRPRSSEFPFAVRQEAVACHVSLLHHRAADRRRELVAELGGTGEGPGREGRCLGKNGADYNYSYQVV